MPISTLPATFEQLLKHEIFDDFVGSGDLYDYLKKEYGLKTPNNCLYHNLLREGFAQLPKADQLHISHPLTPPVSLRFDPPKKRGFLFLYGKRFTVL